MKSPKDMVSSDNEGFGKDPFGYSLLAWHKWTVAQGLAGAPIELDRGPSSNDLKSPVLWLSHAHAMSEAARIVLSGRPNLDSMPFDIRGVVHCQYHAVALMLVGYSLEVCLKAMLILVKGIDLYTEQERQYFKHDLDELADFIPGLTEKEIAIFKGLTHFVRWAGRYPDPGFSKEARVEDIFTLSEHHQVCAKDVFELAARVMAYSKQIVGAV